MTNKFDPQVFLKILSTSPGVYQMLDVQGEIIYIGKAKNLNKRVSSYFLKKSEHSKTTHMVSKIFDIKIIVTETEVEALLLECNLIKKHKPRYNILLRDDKNYPYILVEQSHDFPRLNFYRGARKVKGKLFGPFPNVAAVKETLEFLQKIFKLRSCSDIFFKNRSRPCLQYQIKRCKAPCVAYISKQDYQKDLTMALDFLKGNSDDLLRQLEKNMIEASNRCEFEQAANYRDQIQNLRSVQTSQTISNQGGSADVIAGVMRENNCSVVLMMVRQGQVVGSHSFYPKLPNHDEASSIENVLEAFISQYYLNQNTNLPPEIIANANVSQVLIDAISLKEKTKCVLNNSNRGLKAKWLKLAEQNAETSLNNHLSSKASFKARYQALKEVLKLDVAPQTMECFDISHTGGELTVASCVVFDSLGPKKSDYRKFNIEGITGGDDYAAMDQALTRRYKRLLKENKPLPDLLIIDGGKGQVNIAKKVMAKLDLKNLKIIGVAKGVSRKPGLETIIVAFDGRELNIDSDSPALHLIQYIRDESHRFAIINHRHKRETKTVTSVLEDIDGVGKKRRQALLKRFGGIQNLKVASIDEIKKVPGINLSLANKIHQYFHN